MRDFIQLYIGKKQDTHFVNLYERRSAPPDEHFDTYYDVWNRLFEFLIAYSYAICAEVDTEFASRNHALS